MKYCDTCHSSYPTDFNTCPKDQSALRLATDLLDGTIIRGKYQIVSKIGSGGMATVYRARHLVFDEPRAIKVVGSRMMEDANFLKRFRNEAVITRKLQHPNAVRVEDIDALEDGRPYLVMELVEGASLRAIVESEGPLPYGRALGIARQAASALAEAHRQGIIHRDIKPDNIVLMRQADGSDLVKVLDFGIAKLREGGGAAYTATQTGMVIGTPQYISPEQASGRKLEEIDGRADLYSLGVALYEMLTGQLPFQSETPMALLLAHMQAAVPPPKEVRPDLNIPEPVSRVLLRMLEKDPARRFQTADELIAALADPAKAPVPPPLAQPDSPTAPLTAAAAAPAPARTLSVTRPLPAAPPSHSSPKWIAVTVVAVAIAIGGYFVATRRTVPEPTVHSPAQVTPSVAPPVAAPPAQSVNATTAQPEALKQTIQNAASDALNDKVREWMTSARKHLDNGEYDAAIRDLQKAEAIAPNDARVRTEMKRAREAKATEEQVLGKH